MNYRKLRAQLMGWLGYVGAWSFFIVGMALVIGIATTLLAVAAFMVATASNAWMKTSWDVQMITAMAVLGGLPCFTAMAVYWSIRQWLGERKALRAKKD